MLRITENFETGNTIRLRLDGTVDTISFLEVDAVCSHHKREGGKVILLDLAGVVFMNDEAARKLAELRSERLRIINCSPFIETLLETLEG